ncbi:hypothetical protein CDIK_2296 [Cucumispora dikerogammari]|nr:hypothetical protein CDIK_2296 [Cucumispora dikerogammari]
MKISIRNLENRWRCSYPTVELDKKIAQSHETTFIELVNIDLTQEQVDKLSIKIGEMKKLKHIKLLNLENIFNQKKSICQLLRHVDPIFIQSLCISHVYLPGELPADLCNLLDKAKNLEYLKVTNCNL